MDPHLQTLQRRLEQLRFEWREGNWDATQPDDQPPATESPEDRIYASLANIEPEMQFMHYQDESKAGTESQLTALEEWEKDDIRDEYKLKMEDFYPLTFVSLNNHFERKPGVHDITLSEMSLEDLDVNHFLQRQVMPDKPQPKMPKAQSPNILGLQDFVDEEPEDNYHPDLMTYTSHIQMNFKRIDSALFVQGNQLVMGYEKFPWMREDTLKYAESTGLTLDEKLAILERDKGTEQAIEKNGLLDLRLFVNNKTYRADDSHLYKAPQFTDPVTSVLSGTSLGIDISDVGRVTLEMELRDAMQKCTDPKSHLKSTFMQLLGRMDRIFHENFVNMQFQNQTIQQDNEELALRNHNLLEQLKKVNKNISQCEVNRYQLAQQRIKLGRQREALIRKDVQYRRADDLKMRVEEEKINLREAERQDELSKKSHKELKILNGKLKNLVDRMGRSLQSSQQKLQNVVRGYEQLNSIPEVLTLRSSPRGKTMSQRKLLFKNRTGLSQTTMSRIQDERDRGFVDADLVQDQVLAVKHKVKEAESSLMAEGLRLGYPAEVSTNRPLGKNIDKLTRTTLKTILEETLKDSGDKTPQGQPSEAHLVQDSPSEFRLVERSPGSANRHLASIRSSPSLVTQVINFPSNHKEAALRQAILYNSQACHPITDPKPPVPRAPHRSPPRTLPN